MPRHPSPGSPSAGKPPPGAIEAAGKRGDRLLIVHESLHYPYYFDFDPQRTPDWPSWAINQRRKQQLDHHGLTCLRLHTTIDWLCVTSEMAVWLGLSSPPRDYRTWNSVFDIEPTSLRDLVDRAKRVSGLPALRVAAPRGLDVSVKRIGLLVGGVALVANGAAFEPGVRAGVDAFIAGETDNYGFRYALESGIPLIETSHEVCENPGFRRFSRLLAEAFPQFQVSYYANTCPYQVL
ncbi:MAG: hypothetical protein EA425_09920 [Puniceicoccaceae bacterium]|nr:MAG: hypothetical protein EA425_09920 [Puniceicoccaceae bacterium]